PRLHVRGRGLRRAELDGLVIGVGRFGKVLGRGVFIVCLFLRVAVAEQRTAKNAINLIVLPIVLLRGLLHHRHGLGVVVGLHVGLSFFEQSIEAANLRVFF